MSVFSGGTVVRLSNKSAVLSNVGVPAAQGVSPSELGRRRGSFMCEMCLDRSRSARGHIPEVRGLRSTSHDARNKVDHHNDSITSWRRVGVSGQSESAVPNVKSVALCGDSLMQELSIGVTSCITSSNHGIVHGGDFLFFGAVPPDVCPRENCIALA